jgi:hypothetical protein
MNSMKNYHHHHHKHTDNHLKWLAVEMSKIEAPLTAPSTCLLAPLLSTFFLSIFFCSTFFKHTFQIQRHGYSYSKNDWLFCLTLSAATVTPSRAVDIEAIILHVLCSISYRSTVSKQVESLSPLTAYNGRPRQPTAIQCLNETVLQSYFQKSEQNKLTARCSLVQEVPIDWFVDRILLYYLNEQFHHNHQ